MSFSDLRDHQVTVLQLAEMEEEGSLERFARGWYWCKDCGYEKPEDYQYIEIAKVNPRAVICMDSAAWLAGMLKEEPATIAVATARTDRKKMDLENFEIRRFYFQNADIPGEICEKKTEFGSYKYYSPKSAHEQQDAGGSKRRNPHLVPETEIFQRRDSGIREQAPCGKKYRGRVSEIKFHRNR